MSVKHVKFQRGEDPNNLKMYEYNTSTTIKDMLYDYLKQTNSIMTLDAEKITFMAKGILNNKESTLNKTVGQYFKALDNVVVKVYDNSGIIGRNVCVA